MVAYNFKNQFEYLILSGQKCQTIRREGKRRHARMGERIQIYTGMRTVKCRKIIPDPLCIVSTYCAIYESGVTTGVYPTTDLDVFAKYDGFTNFEEMKRWFQRTHGLPFIGRLIAWEVDRAR